MSRDDLHFRLRIPEDLKKKVEISARENHRSMTAEIIARLEATFTVNQKALQAEIVKEWPREDDVAANTEDFVRQVEGFVKAIQAAAKQLREISNPSEDDKP